MNHCLVFSYFRAVVKTEYFGTCVLEFYLREGIAHYIKYC